MDEDGDDQRELVESDDRREMALVFEDRRVMKLDEGVVEGKDVGRFGDGWIEDSVKYDDFGENSVAGSTRCSSSLQKT